MTKSHINFKNIPKWLLDIEKYIDQYNIMSYYPGTVWIGSGWHSWHGSALKGETPNTPTSISSTLEILSKAGFPKEKLGMGVAFYAFGYTGNITVPNQETSWEKNNFFGGDNTFPLWKLYNSEGLELQKKYRKWDANASVPYLSFTDPSPFNNCYYISYEDKESIYAKGKFARENGYGGIIIWTISQGYVAENPPENRNPLLKNIYEAFILEK